MGWEPERIQVALNVCGVRLAEVRSPAHGCFRSGITRFLDVSMRQRPRRLDQSAHGCAQLTLPCDTPSIQDCSKHTMTVRNYNMSTMPS